MKGLLRIYTYLRKKQKRRNKIFCCGLDRYSTHFLFSGTGIPALGASRHPGRDVLQTQNGWNSGQVLCFFIFLSGFATLAWEVIWQIKSTLALGVSAWGTAITLIVMMGGMGLGALLMGRKCVNVSSLHLYGSLEIVIGLSGLLLNSAFGILEKLDSWVYAGIASSISFVYLFGIVAILGIPTLCMGATLPVFGLISKQYQLSLTKLYSLNTLGAASGVLFVAFIVIPFLGVTHTLWVISAINILIGCIALLWNAPKELTDLTASEAVVLESVSWVNLFLVFVTGFATFTLEIAWFRSLLSVFPNTADVFAIILACMLMALGLAAKQIQHLKNKKIELGKQMCIAGILILLVTPLIERIGNLSIYYKKMMVKMAAQSIYAVSPDKVVNDGSAIFIYAIHVLMSFLFVSILIVPAMRFLGMTFPWILDDHRSSSSIGKIYAVNTLAAVVGSIIAAWLLLPAIGFAKTAWIAGVLVTIGGVYILPNKKRFIWIICSVAALSAAIVFETGIGKTHVQGFFSTDDQGNPAKILGFFEGPDATISALEYQDGARSLLINSTLAAGESGVQSKSSVHYMAWMGHLPMLLHPNPKQALVICFGTGQTANALREENPEQLDIVDINSRVFQLGHFFASNKNVLDDPRVKKIVMDGRAYLRRTKKQYDVITLEPMPPGTVGVNALYSKEFYELARDRLSPQGVIAQWLPFHAVAPFYTASIAKTFIDVFQNAVLWIDPDSKTGILLGTKDESISFATQWPGLRRNFVTRNLSDEQIKQYVALTADELKAYGQYGKIINDDNQLLTYGKVLYASNMTDENFALLNHIRYPNN